MQDCVRINMDVGQISQISLAAGGVASQGSTLSGDVGGVWDHSAGPTATPFPNTMARRQSLHDWKPGVNDRLGAARWETSTQGNNVALVYWNGCFKFVHADGFEVPPPGTGTGLMIVIGGSAIDASARMQKVHVVPHLDKATKLARGHSGMFRCLNPFRRSLRVGNALRMFPDRKLQTVALVSEPGHMSTLTGMVESESLVPIVLALGWEVDSLQRWERQAVSSGWVRDAW
ncbi:uncharacterized protein EI90DRAFT_3015520 [Cantharellus anzutake]|uniref:uncharacterized protein n=1 Tax=Cantharellus anzutake TaxID=1750568 RepID=UPI001904933B|nr:uncharacterized protein EI90DRAFT_3015520 [Cantharellus anzutake]KAF8333057.1 hypothetical protein EI90DRAFT_3015520 [Cantharellus anzutake]